MDEVRSRPRFSIAVHTYLWVFFVLVCLVPLFVTKVVADRVPLPLVYWVAAFVWPVAIAVLFFYARRQCSSANMAFRDGLLWVTASMMTGWTYQSFMTVFPALAAAFCGAIFISFAEDLRREPGYAQDRWRQVVRFFYGHRMRQ